MTSSFPREIVPVVCGASDDSDCEWSSSDEDEPGSGEGSLAASGNKTYAKKCRGDELDLGGDSNVGSGCENNGVDGVSCQGDVDSSNVQHGEKSAESTHAEDRPAPSVEECKEILMDNERAAYLEGEMDDFIEDEEESSVVCLATLNIQQCTVLGSIPLSQHSFLFLFRRVPFVLGLSLSFDL